VSNFRFHPNTILLLYVIQQYLRKELGFPALLVGDEHRPYVSVHFQDEDWRIYAERWP
jgi:hypothetical protein